MDGDRVERRPLGQTAAAVADHDLDVCAAERVEVAARAASASAGWRSTLITSAASSGEDRRRVAGAGPDLEHPLAALQLSAWQIAATIHGCEIVCPSPIGRAESA